MLVWRTILCFAATLVLGSAPQSRGQPSVTGIYSDMASSDGEHIGGIEVFVLRGGGKYFVMLQTAEGTSSIPVVVPARIVGDTLTFDLRETIQRSLGQFSGRFEGGHLIGEFTGWRSRQNLPRRSSFWQQ